VRGITDRINKDGIRIVRVHYSADDGKNDQDPEGKKWLLGELRGYPGGKEGAKWKREMEIDFEATGGELVFPQLERNKDRILIEPNVTKIPDHWKLYGGFDYAGRGMTAFVVIAWDKKQDDYYCIHEFYKKNSGYIQTSEHIRNCEYYDKLEWIVADPSMWTRTQERSGQTDLVSMAQLFSEVGVHFVKGVRGGDSEFAEIANSKFWGMLDQGELGKGKSGNISKTQPKWRVWKNCPNLWWELTKWRYNEWANSTGANKNPKETMVDKDNHLIDACKYLFKMVSSNWMADRVDTFDIENHVIN
jgi:hypothetical protein